MIEPTPCPWCHHKTRHQGKGPRVEDTSDMVTGEQYWWVRCGDNDDGVPDKNQDGSLSGHCVTGPVRRTRGAAIRAWNLRVN